MEGPSLVIATEEFKKFEGKKLKAARGTAKLPFASMNKLVFKRAVSWGKHFILVFEKDLKLRIHFLMFGSYRIDNERANREPKMTLVFPNGTVNFYSCAIKALEGELRDLYDWSTDIMSGEWDAKAALGKLRERPDEMVCDLLMDQTIFSGLGNIMKNETLFNLRMHPEATVSKLTAAQQRALVKEARSYALQFYEWKKQNVLKRNWRIFRQKECARCHVPPEKRMTGKGERFSFYCPKCQTVGAPKTKSGTRSATKPVKTSGQRSASI